MKILLVSDTHHNFLLLDELNNKYKDFLKIDLGDRGYPKSFLEKNNFKYVDGNCDDTQDVKTLVVECENNKILITHGDLYNVGYTLNNLYYKAKELNCNYVFYGHTHIQRKDIYDDIIFINPGALKDNHYCLIIDNEIIFK